MYRQPSRQLLAAVRPRNIPRSTTARRFLSTAPPHERSRSWKNTFARWGLAGGLLYYYNTSSVFADEPTYTVHAPPETRHENEQESYQSIDEIAAERNARKQQAAATAAESADVAVAGSPDELEAEADQQGAFNEETGEINWDCPCLGGMAHGPCGEEFRAAFSCFVFSKEEPKGVDCIDKFKGMQECFRAHPDIYGAELDDEDPELVGEDGPGQVPAGAEVGVGAASASSPTSASATTPTSAAKAVEETSVAS
ncbi:Mitochondrial intermembrane space import and assembly protein 40 [Sphaceloma murrayae]|uniref:Mitochondrial intermembrane space import and assembly protein 40 n=1 Tax=Sphaceloma murrayae TaxID=2082308 RepID=A0A2K1QNP4_9PEZI|nr:Mitochondrial intermembrane space import and assembly protein 40 [Sphaceloma murrayae]